MQVHSEAPAVAVAAGLAGAGALGTREPLGWRAGTVLQCEGLAGDRAPICSTETPAHQPSGPSPGSTPLPRLPRVPTGLAGHTECHPLTPPPPSHSPRGHPRRALRPITGCPGWRFGAGQPFPPHREPGAAHTRGSISPPGCRAAYPHGCAHGTRVCRKLRPPSLLQGLQAPTAAARVAQGCTGEPLSPSQCPRASMSACFPSPAPRVNPCRLVPSPSTHPQTHTRSRSA